MNRLSMVLIYLYSSVAVADADVELISITGPGASIGFIAPTTFVEAEFKFRNNGPDAIAASVSGIKSAFSANTGSRTIDVQPSTREQPCRYLEEVIDDGPNSFLAVVSLVLNRPFAAGESVSCYARLGVYRQAPEVFGIGNRQQRQCEWR